MPCAHLRIPATHHDDRTRDVMSVRRVTRGGRYTRDRCMQAARLDAGGGGLKRHSKSDPQIMDVMTGPADPSTSADEQTDKSTPSGEGMSAEDAAIVRRIRTRCP